MSDKPNAKNNAREVDRIKTGSFERRLSLTRAGLVAGSRLAGNMAANLFKSREKREESRREALSRQAQYLVEELGQLKGSVVKIGQVMALYGEHFLPVEVTEALHTLEDRTTALGWSKIHQVLLQELGADKLKELDIQHEPIGAASLGQVHRARRKSDGRELCLKIQYPGVAEAVDSDLDSVARLLKVARMVSFGPDFDEWLEEVRVMMHREVNYSLELETTRRFGEMLKDDDRFVVPEVFPEYSTSHVMATSYEPGLGVTHAQVQELSLARRNHLAQAALELFFRELFVWGELQTDPNFGNYRIRLGANPGEPDRIVLLDFGAVQKYPDSFIRPVCDMIRASYERDLERVIEGAVKLRFMRLDWPASVLDEFGKVCMAVLEPLAAEAEDVPDFALNADNEYCWRRSDLPTRIAKRAAKSAINRYFQIPPKEFVFLNRKLVGVYTFVSVLDAEFNGSAILERYLYPQTAAQGV
ncbi:AarF/ABC1/UbiB kinase family protein [Hahella sp. KA22]|uniref:ABC1 kinase family protein n=1 Tax=Hahella sp. KA22 TaxID=1628392 RepID=UPI000FDD8046|nr:AarF/ABC1/UbiB kinase family protein [Hahella sp. KA22]AZZ90540.1 AarF/ABC1/UbiB kinase family protein [Hahella sp. KA22]QAY53910.1 AarF/ABC1/UbiB kinase family protein [Hahella sp. KA22]